MTSTTKWPPTVSMDAAGLDEPIRELAGLALRFAGVHRRTLLPDGSPESDTDHTVMLGWIAPALAARCCEDLDVGLVAQFALVHDAPEVLCGDTPTLRISAAERAVKETREARAAEALARMFGASLPWFPETILRYERQEDPEARFVWALDKLIVKIVNLYAECRSITSQGVDAAGLEEMIAVQRPKLAARAGEFAGLLGLYDRLCREVLARLRELALPEGVPDNAAALAVTLEQSGHVRHVCEVTHDDGGWSCQFCAGGLFACDRCDSFEGATTTHCPGQAMTAEEHDAVYAGTLDFRRSGDGSGWWVGVGSPHSPGKGWVPWRVHPGTAPSPVEAAIEWVMEGPA